MPRFAANLSMLYPEHDFLDRFEAAARDGFGAVEFLFPYAYEPAELAARLRAHRLKQVLFNAPPGDWEGGERGLACLAGREAEFREGIANALRHAQPTSLTISLCLVDDVLTVAVEDDGGGLGTDVTRSGTSRLAERLAVVGGTLDLVGVPGDGARLEGRLRIGAAVRA